MVRCLPADSKAPPPSPPDPPLNSPGGRAGPRRKRTRLVGHPSPACGVRWRNDAPARHVPYTARLALGAVALTVWGRAVGSAADERLKTDRARFEAVRSRCVAREGAIVEARQTATLSS